MNAIIKKETRLELAAEHGDDISSILNYKLKSLQENNLPVEAGLADYIALGIGSFKEKKDQLKAYKKQLDEAIKGLDEFEKETASETFDWLKENGIDKLNGIHCSSVTTKDASVSVRKKIVRDVSDSQLVELGYAHEEEIISEIKPTVKINAKRKIS